MSLYHTLEALARTPALLHRPSGKLLLDTGSLGAVKAFLTQ